MITFMVLTQRSSIKGKVITDYNLLNKTQVFCGIHIKKRPTNKGRSFLLLCLLHIKQ